MFTTATLLIGGAAYLMALGCGSTPATTNTQVLRQALQIGARNLIVAGSASSLTRLTQSNRAEVAPALSPDHKQLIFGVVTFNNGVESSEVLTSVDPATGARRTLFTPEGVVSGQPMWMPNGKALVYRSNRSGPFALVRSLSASPNSGVAIVMDARQAPDIAWPALSPDGGRIAAQAVIAGVSSVVVLSVGKSQYAVLGEGVQPSFSPDGKRLAFARQVGDTYQVFTMNADDGTDVMQLTQGDYSSAQPSFSPDGKWIVFVSNRSSSSRNAKYDGTWNLFATKLDGSDLIQLTDGNADNSKPTWATDGFIYFASNQAGNYDIWRLKPQGELVSTAQ